MQEVNGYLASHGQLLLEAGYSIVPIKKGLKYPGVNGWENIIADEDRLRKWLSGKWSDGGVGILSASTPGVDLDILDVRIALHMQSFVESRLGFAPVRIGKTPKRLLMYRTEKPFSKVQSARWEDFAGQANKVEILGQGQQFVAFHVHPDTGKPYEWLHNDGPHITRWEDLPVLNEDDAHAICNEFDRMAEAEGWTRKNNALASPTGKTRPQGIIVDRDDPFIADAPKVEIGEEELQRLLMLAPGSDDYDTWLQVGMALYHQFDGAERGLELWDQWSAQAANYDRNALEAKWPTFDISDKRRAPITAASILRLAGYPRPQPLTIKIDPTPYPVAALPSIVRAAVEEVAEFVKAPMPLVASSALAALSVACQAHIDVQRAEKLSGPTGLFLLTIADSGERKTTCDNFFSKSIRDHEQEQAVLMQSGIKEYSAKLAAWGAERDGLLLKIKSSSRAGKSTDELRDELVRLELVQPQAPRVPRFMLGDETPEALAWSLAKLWPSSGVISSEAGQVLGSHGMGQDSVMRNLALLNLLWDGGTHSVGRKSSENFTVRGARLTVGLQIQTDALQSFFEKSGTLARGIGFFARFLVAWPQSTQGTRTFTEAPLEWPHLDVFHRRIAKILTSPIPMDDSGGLTPILLRLSPDAKTAWVAYHDSIEAKLLPDGELHDVRDVAAKSADNAVRLAALFHYFEHEVGNISLDSFQRASQIAEWHLLEARRFFGELALPTELVDAMRLDGWLINYCQRTLTEYVNKNHVRQRGPLRDGNRLNSALAELANLDRLRLIRQGKSTQIFVNQELVVETTNPRD